MARVFGGRFEGWSGGKGTTGAGCPERMVGVAGASSREVHGLFTFESSFGHMGRAWSDRDEEESVERMAGS